jgi:tRNA A-37 threonylcarbamoyl transferase component Bud32
MGIVYEGFDPVIDRIVAIKTIKQDELDQEEAEEHSRRFLIEAKAAGRLNHKNIVGIYDYGEEKGLSFIVMEFVPGKELKAFFAARHPFSMSQIVRLMGELLDALGYSHSRGVVHRDVKPDNIFVTDDGSVKLGDFGIARIDSTSKTHAGTVLGTPNYMAPEQIRGETADARSDLYAAGVILYQFLVGERPFSGGMVAIMQKVLMEAPKPPSSHNPSIPEAIDAVVLKALAKASNDRFASAAEFSRALTAAVGLADSEDESESTMIMSAETLKSFQDGVLPADRTGTGTGGTHPGTGAGTGTGRAYALASAAQAEPEARQADLAAAAAAQDALAERVEREGKAALAAFEQKLEVLEERLAGQDGAWGAESRALEALDPAAGEAPIDAIQARLDKLATSVEQVGKGFASVQAQPLMLPTAQAERLAVIDAQLKAQSEFVTRLRAEAEAARKNAEEAARLNEARRTRDAAVAAGAADPDAIMIAKTTLLGGDDAESTMIQPIGDKAPTPTARATPAEPGKTPPLLPIAGVAVVALAVGAWFALRPAPTGEAVGPPSGVTTAASVPAPMPGPAPAPAARAPDLETKAHGDAEGKPQPDADAKAKVDADKQVKTDPKADAADMFRKGYEAYLAGRVPEGIRMMERADAMSAQGVRARLCAIYRRPTAAEGKDFLKEAKKCKGVD